MAFEVAGMWSQLAAGVGRWDLLLSCGCAFSHCDHEQGGAHAVTLFELIDRLSPEVGYGQRAIWSPCNMATETGSALRCMRAWHAPQRDGAEEAAFPLC